MAGGLVRLATAGDDSFSRNFVIPESGGRDERGFQMAKLASPSWPGKPSGYCWPLAMFIKF